MMPAHLYARPRRPPKWWPRDRAGGPAWVGVFKDGVGWCMGAGDLMSACEIATAKDLLELALHLFTVVDRKAVQAPE